MDKKTVLSDIALELIELDKKYKKTYNTTDVIIRDFYRKHSVFQDESWRVEGYRSFSEFKSSVLNGSQVDEVTRDSLCIVKESKDTGKVYVVTAAIEGDSLCKPFYKAIKTFQKANNAELVVLPMRGVRAGDKGYSKELLEESDHFATEYRFNSNVKCLDLKLHPRQFLPLSQINRLATDSSIIVAHSKVQFEVSPTSFGKLPRLIMSTGAVTNGDTYGEIRSGKISEIDHKIGAIILEIENDEIFYMRNVEFDSKSDSFYDLDKQYFASGNIRNAKARAIYLGDYHSGYTDQAALNATYNMINVLKPSDCFVGDTFDGTSISHHHINNMKSQLSRPKHLETLESELGVFADNLKDFIEKCPLTTLNLIEGNHDNHLEFYLRECRYKDDRMNHLLALKLAIHMLEGRNPISEYVFEKYPNLSKKIKFLTRRDSIRIADVEMSQHGDLASSGIKGGVVAVEKSFYKACVGHTHTPRIHRDLYVAGTLSKFDMPYVSATMTKWLHTNISIYSNGQRQILNIIFGKWRMEK